MGLDIQVLTSEKDRVKASWPNGAATAHPCGIIRPSTHTPALVTRRGDYVRPPVFPARGPDEENFFPSICMLGIRLRLDP